MLYVKLFYIAMCIIVEKNFGYSLAVPGKKHLF